ncbi:hypothetical protein [Flavobacterium sp.]|uniref:hypothetical protein n=1 Tax=Flavobacterium sp. TaxID=239 RepID=UPI004048E8D1
MNIDFELDFFYYRKEIGLDYEDQHMKKLYPHISNAIDFVAGGSLGNVFRLFTRTYAKKYPLTDNWFGLFLIKGSSKYIVKDPDYVDDELDFFISDAMNSRPDISSIYFKQIRDGKSGLLYLEYTEFIFKNPENVSVIASAIEKELDGLTYNKQTGDETIYEVLNSPIKKIELSSSKFKLTINKDYWDKNLGSF